MKLKKKRWAYKVFLGFGTLSVVGSSLVTAVACSTAPSDANKYNNMVIDKNDSVTGVLNYYYGVILTDRFKENNKESADAVMKPIFQNYVKWKNTQDSSYWATQYSTWISSGLVSTNTTDKNYLDPTEFDPTNFTFGQNDKDYTVMKNYIPTLLLDVNKLTITIEYFLEQKSEVKKYFNLKESSADIDKKYQDSNNYFLTKWLQENKPSLAWQVSIPNTHAMSSADGTDEWNNMIEKSTDLRKVAPFSNINNLLNEGSSDNTKYIPNQDAVNWNGDKSPGYKKLNQVTSGKPIDLTKIGGFLGLVTKSDTFGKHTSGFDWSDADIDRAKGNENHGEFGFVGSAGITNDATQLQTAPGKDNTVLNSSDGKNWVRSIAYQITNVSTHKKDDDDKYYYSYDLSGMMQNKDFMNDIMMMISMQNTSLTDTAREYYWTLGYKLHVYNDTLKKKLQGISNLLADD